MVADHGKGFTMSKVIRVQFHNGPFMQTEENRRTLDTREYDYFLVRDDVEVRKGSLAVVEVNDRSAGNCLKLVHICAVLARSNKATKYAITVFSLDEHKELLKKKEDIATLREAILSRAEESRQKQKLLELADSDPQLKAMLDELNTLEAGA